MRPLESMFGWYICVVNRTSGGSSGYLRRTQGRKGECHLVRPNKLKRPHHAARREQTHRSGMRTSSLKTPPAYTLSGGPWTCAVKWLRATPSAGKHEMPGGDAFANSFISRCMRVDHMCDGGQTLSCLG